MSTPRNDRGTVPASEANLAQSSEMVEVPEVMLGPRGSLSDGASSHQTERVCCTLWGGVKI